MLSIAKIHKFTAKLTITGGNNVRPMFRPQFRFIQNVSRSYKVIRT